MAEKTTIARPYARAAFEIAADSLGDDRPESIRLERGEPRGAGTRTMTLIMMMGRHGRDAGRDGLFGADSKHK